MPRPQHVLAWAVSVALLVACGGDAPGSGRSGPGVDERRSRGPMMGMDMRQMMEMMGNMPEGIAASELPAPSSAGARLVARYCAQCDAIPTPRRFAAEEWEPTLRRMPVRMERMSRVPMHRIRLPSSAERETMIAYLQANALRSVEADSIPTGDPDAGLFARTCSRCHTLPDPAQHTAEEWPTR